MVASIYTTAVVALERYVGVSRPINVYVSASRGDGDRNKWRTLLLYVGPVLVFSVLFNLPTFFEFEVKLESVKGETGKQRDRIAKCRSIVFVFLTWYRGIRGTAFFEVNGNI